MILGISMGCAHKFIKSKNRNEVLTVFRENFEDKINAIEIVIPEDNINDFKIDKKNYQWLMSLNHISLHLLDTESSFIKHSNMILAQKIYISYFIKHIDNKDMRFKYYADNKILYENISYPVNNDYFLNKNNICFDVSHALLNNMEYLNVFYWLFKDKIKQIHLSNTIDNKCHQLFYNNPGLFYEIKSHIDLKKYPIIIENSCESLDELGKEINFLKDNIYGM